MKKVTTLPTFFIMTLKSRDSFYDEESRLFYFCCLDGCFVRFVGIHLAFADILLLRAGICLASADIYLTSEGYPPSFARIFTLLSRIFHSFARVFTLLSRIFYSFERVFTSIPRVFSCSAPIFASLVRNSLFPCVSLRLKASLLKYRLKPI